MKHARLLALGAVFAALGLMASDADAQAISVSRSDIDVTGINVTANTPSAPSSTIYFANDGYTLLAVRNTSNTNVSATVNTVATAVMVDGFGPISLSNTTVTIPSNSTVLIGPFAKGRWNNSIYDTVGVTFSSSTFISTTAIRIPPQQ